jgi:HAD superfamily hydrolase (TIGR01490 family)
LSVALFDLDRTLLDCNSGRLWLSYEWRSGRLRTSEVLTGAWWLLKYSLGNHELTGAYRSAVAKLKGEEEQVIAERTRLWFEQYVAHRLRPGAREALEAHRLAGDQLILATSSSPYIAACAQRAFGLDDTISSIFEVEEGRFTGEVVSMALGPAKADRAREWALANAVQLENCIFYTDSMTDLALLEAVGSPVVINPDRPLAKLAHTRGWVVEDWGRSTGRPE